MSTKNVYTTFSASPVRDPSLRLGRCPWRFISNKASPVRAVVSNGASQTKALGRKLAKEILREPPGDKAFVVALEGELASGKTTFIQGFAKGLGIKQKILSPTFVILKKFKITNRHINILTYRNFFHLDCYRIENQKEILALGFKKIIANPQNIVAIEWAEKIKKILPKQTLWLKFEFKGRNKRKIVVK